MSWRRSPVPDNPASKSRKPKRCPYCGNDRVDRARRRWYERLLLVRRVYYCGRCRKRTAIWPFGVGLPDEVSDE